MSGLLATAAAKLAETFKVHVVILVTATIPAGVAQSLLAVVPSLVENGGQDCSVE